MWTIKQIFDGDYGCEEREASARQMVSVTVVDENGNEKYINVEEDWLTKMGLDEGDAWVEESTVHHGCYNEPSPDGKDVYGISDKLREHFAKIEGRK